MIRTFFGITVAMALIANSAQAQTAEKQCILAAAEKLPVIQGLVIRASRTKEMSKEAVRPPGGAALVVEIDVLAAGQEATYSFACVAYGDPNQPPFASLLRVSR